MTVTRAMTLDCVIPRIYSRELNQYWFGRNLSRLFKHRVHMTETYPAVTAFADSHPIESYSLGDLRAQCRELLADLATCRVDIASLRGSEAQLKAENERLDAWVDEIQRNDKSWSCAFCGKRLRDTLPDDKKTVRELLGAHSRTCTHHPMSKMVKALGICTNSGDSFTKDVAARALE